MMIPSVTALSRYVIACGVSCFLCDCFFVLRAFLKQGIFSNRNSHKTGEEFNQNPPKPNPNQIYEWNSLELVFLREKKNNDELWIVSVGSLLLAPPEW
jgi:hypothetical protein